MQRFRVDAARKSWRRRAPLFGALFFFVACTFTYYGQLNRVQTGDVYGTMYTAVGIVQKHTIWLDRYLPYIQQHAGKYPYMVTTGPGGHYVNVTPSASTLLALPAVAIFSAFGVKASNWDAWMEAGMLTAALTAAATVAAMFVLLTRLTTRPRAALVAATFAWGTLQWEINGQSPWSHGGATLALVLGLLALVERRLTWAGVALSAMVAFRLRTPPIAILLLPLVGRQLRDWGRFLAGILPFAVPLLAYNWIAFGSPLHQGYGTAHLTQAVHLDVVRTLRDSLALLVSPGRGLFVYMPILLFSVVGAVRGRRVPLYRWCAVASLVYLLVVGNDIQWYGGESFGPRKLVDVLPLLVVLLVPALDAIVQSRWRWVFGGLLAWSVFVELLGASASPPSVWFDRNLPLTTYSTWWSVTNNEIEAMLGTQGLALRLLAMLGLLVGSLALGYVASATVARRREPLEAATA